jgi:hypothetical protein
VTAFLLFKNGVIKEDDVMDAHSVPQVVDAESRRLRDAA